MKNTLIALSLVALSAVASFAHADAKPEANVEDYSYSTKLDIAKVISSPSLDFCGIQPVEMTYLDHMGKSHTLRYSVYGSSCLGEN